MRHFLPLAGVLLFLFSGCRPDPEKALKKFYTNQAPECALSYPLWAAGKSIVPLLLEEVKSKSMPRRRYAIIFLGDVGDVRAADLLANIVDDSAEVRYVRADALEALSKLDRSRAVALASNLGGEQGLLGTTAQYINDGGEFESSDYRETRRNCP